jgi:hypothetical protein
MKIVYNCSQFDVLQAGDVINMKELLTNSLCSLY